MGLRSYFTWSIFLCLLLCSLTARKQIMVGESRIPGKTNKKRFVVCYMRDGTRMQSGHLGRAGLVDITASTCELRNQPLYSGSKDRFQDYCRFITRGRGAGSSVLLVKLTAWWFFMPSQTSQTWNFTMTGVDSSAEQLLFIDCMETSWMRDVQTMHL